MKLIKLKPVRAHGVGPTIACFEDVAEACKALDLIQVEVNYTDLHQRLSQEFPHWDVRVGASKVILTHPQRDLIKVVVTWSTHSMLKVSAYAKTGLGGWKISKFEEVYPVSLGNLKPAGGSASRYGIGTKPDKIDTYSRFVQWGEVITAVDNMMRVEAVEDVVGKVAKALKKEFQGRKQGGITINVKARTQKVTVPNPPPAWKTMQVRATCIIFGLAYDIKGPYELKKDVATLAITGKEAILSTSGAHLWEYGRGNEQKFDLSDPDSVPKMIAATEAALNSYLTESVPVARSHYESSLARLRSMRKFLNDLEKMTDE